MMKHKYRSLLIEISQGFTRSGWPCGGVLTTCMRNQQLTLALEQYLGTRVAATLAARFLSLLGGEHPSKAA